MNFKYLGKRVLVKLPEFLLEEFNRGRESHDPVVAGDVRPADVVGESVGQTQEIATGERTPKGELVKKTIDLPDTVNLQIHRDGSAPHLYVTGVPVDALHDVGSDPTAESTDQEVSADKEESAPEVQEAVKPAEPVTWGPAQPVVEPEKAAETPKW